MYKLTLVLGIGLLMSTAFPQPSTLVRLRYDPFGPDRNCNDFSSYEEAYAFFVAAGGPKEDPHRLDRDNDGIPCEALRD